jgi:hypothetical protein
MMPIFRSTSSVSVKCFRTSSKVVIYQQLAGCVFVIDGLVHVIGVPGDKPGTNKDPPAYISQKFYKENLAGL